MSFLIEGHYNYGGVIDEGACVPFWELGRVSAVACRENRDKSKTNKEITKDKRNSGTIVASDKRLVREGVLSGCVCGCVVVT